MTSSAAIQPGSTASRQPAASLQVRRRRDLKFQSVETARWNVLDPITRQSYRIGLIEHWLLTRPDGQLTVAQLLAKLRAEFPQLLHSDEQIVGMISSFHINGLLVSSSCKLPPREAVGFWQAWLASTVVWQIRGLQPDRFLSRLAPYTGGLFSGQAVRCWLTLAACTCLLVLLDFKHLAAQSLSLEWILHPSTGGWLFIVFIATRALHELGHALVCKRFGIRCPDIGLFMILGAPCVYCDVSESWQLPRRWQRAAVAAAGMYVELIVATLAAWLWLATIPGAINTLALQTMLVCSLSTLIININPLMRFDGYYILADWLDEVNLRSKADLVAGAWLRRWVVGSSLSPPLQIPSRRRQFLLVFSLAGWCYRAMLSVTIATVLIAMYSAWHLPWLGRFLATAVIVSWWGIPAVKIFSELIHLAREQRRQWRLAAVTAMVVTLIAWFPLPHRRLASGWLQPSESQGVYATAQGRLRDCAVRDGETVTAGQPLFELSSRELATRLVRYRQSHQVAAIRLEAHRRQRDMHSQDVDVEHYVHQLDETRNWLNGVQREVDGLTLTAPRDGQLVGMVAPPASEPTQRPAAPLAYETGGQAELHMATWCDPQQFGRLVPQGSLLACICSQRRIAVLPLDEQQLASVAVGTPVRLRLTDQRLVLKSCVVKSVVQIEELSSPWQAAALAKLNATATQFTQPTGARFAAIVELPPQVGGIPGSTVDAVFIGPSTTIASLALRWMHANLRLFAD